MIEWLPVASSAFAVSFLLVPLLVRVERRYLMLCAAILIIQGFVGVLGFVLHIAADLEGSSGSLFENLVHVRDPRILISSAHPENRLVNKAVSK